MASHIGGFSFGFDPDPCCRSVVFRLAMTIYLAMTNVHVVSRWVQLFVLSPPSRSYAFLLNSRIYTACTPFAGLGSWDIPELCQLSRTPLSNASSRLETTLESDSVPQHLPWSKPNLVDAGLSVPVLIFSKTACGTRTLQLSKMVIPLCLVRS